MTCMHACTHARCIPRLFFTTPTRTKYMHVTTRRGKVRTHWTAGIKRTTSIRARPLHPIYAMPITCRAYDNRSQTPHDCNPLKHLFVHLVRADVFFFSFVLLRSLVCVCSCSCSCSFVVVLPPRKDRKGPPRKRDKNPNTSPSS